MKLLDPMTCDGLQNVEDLPGDPAHYYAELKLDGFRAVTLVKEEGVEIYSRSFKPQHTENPKLPCRQPASLGLGRIPHIGEQIHSRFPTGTILDGEVCAMGRPGDALGGFKYVQSVMLSLPARSREVQRNDQWLDYVVFDLMMYDGEDVRGYALDERRKLLEQHSAELNVLGGSGGPISPNVHLSTAWQPSQARHDELIKKGAEGTVYKRKDSTYRNGHYAGWWKIKAAWDMDVVVIGSIPGTPGTAYDRLIGGIVFGQSQSALLEAEESVDGMDVTVHSVGGLEPELYIERGSCSGIDLDMRKALTEIGDDGVPRIRRDRLGEVMTIRHNGQYEDSVRVRHPVFCRWRPDKLASQVRWRTK
jgi:ATP-dependent DNA ligase